MEGGPEGGWKEDGRRMGGGWKKDGRRMEEGWEEDVFIFKMNFISYSNVFNQVTLLKFDLSP